MPPWIRGVTMCRRKGSTSSWLPGHNMHSYDQGIPLWPSLLGMCGAVCGAWFWNQAVGTQHWQDYLISWVAWQILKKFFAPAASSGCFCPREEYLTILSEWLIWINWLSLIHYCTSEMVLCPILWGINLSHIYAREVRWNFEFNSWYSSKICSCLSKKFGTVYTYFFL